MFFTLKDGALSIFERMYFLDFSTIVLIHVEYGVRSYIFVIRL